MTYVQNPKNGGKPIQLNICWDEILQVYGDKPIPSGWFLMLKTCLEGTKNKTYPEQEKMLKEFNKETGIEHRLPSFMEAAVSMLMEYICSEDSNTRLFSDEYTRTSNTLDGFLLVVGSFGPGGPIVLDSYDDYAYDNFGLALVRPCGSSPAHSPPHPMMHRRGPRLALDPMRGKPRHSWLTITHKLPPCELRPKNLQ